MFRLLKDDSSRNLYPWAVLRIWCQNGNKVHLDTNLGNNAFISRLLIYAWLHTNKTAYLFTKGVKKYSHILFMKWPIVDPPPPPPQYRVKAIMVILAILRNLTILGVGVAIMDINQNASIEMYLEYLLLSV